MPVGASHKEPLRTGGEHRYLTMVIPEYMLLRSKEDVLADSVDVPHVGEGACLRRNLIAQAMKFKEAVCSRRKVAEVALTSRIDPPVGCDGQRPDDRLVG